jgi:hypothetical protein|tara:strand:+ start:822 stop:1097 length:276 start_codon:yes stop_codon:yes gene_type:complete
MKEVKLSSGKKAKVMEMSVDDIDFCNDIPELIQDGENTIIRNLSRARTAWLRRGVEGCDDKFIKSLSETDKTELSLKVQEYQGLGEENPSH